MKSDWTAFQPTTQRDYDPRTHTHETHAIVTTARRVVVDGPLGKYDTIERTNRPERIQKGTYGASERLGFQEGGSNASGYDLKRGLSELNRQQTKIASLRGLTQGISFERKRNQTIKAEIKKSNQQIKREQEYQARFRGQPGGNKK